MPILATRVENTIGLHNPYDFVSSSHSAFHTPFDSSSSVLARQPTGTGASGVGGMASVLVFLAGFSIFIAVSTHFAADHVRQSTSERNAYETARYEVAAEESLERKYRLQPSLEIRESHAAAASSLVTNLELARSLSDDAADSVFIDDTLATHVGYLAAAAHMFEVVDLGDTALVDEIDVHEVDPLFGSIDAGVNATADAFGIEAAQDLTTLNNLENMVLTTTPVVFVISLLLLGLFWVVLGSFQRRIDQTAARFRSLVQNASDVVTILAPDSTLAYASPAAKQVWAMDPEALVGTQAFALVHPDDLPAARAHLAEALKQPATNIGTELRIQHGDGSWRDCKVVANNLIRQPAVAGIVLTYSDITEHKQFEQQLKQLAFHDSLTGLPNRALFTDRLERALAHANRDFRSVGVLFLDVDNFKVVNDSLGHQQGDALLTQMAARIRSCMRAEDTVALFCWSTARSSSPSTSA